MCETCEQHPIPISREDFEHCVQSPTCPECGRTVPADEAWQVYDPKAHTLPEPSPEVMRKLAELDA